MNNMPPKLREELANDPYYLTCARWEEGECDGRITWEHAWIYASKQIQEKWAVIPLCWYHHLGEGLDKKLNQWISLQRADLDDLCIRLYKKNWRQEYTFLQSYEKPKQGN